MRMITSVMVAIVILLSGCSTVQGPSISKQDVNDAAKEMEVKAFKYNMEQVKRINRIGYTIVKSIPKDDIKIPPRPDLGLYVLPRNRITNRMYKQKPVEGVYIGYVFEGTPVAKSGIQEGDILVAIGSQKIENIYTLAKLIKQSMKENGAKTGDQLTLSILRNGQKMDMKVMVEEVPVNVAFSLSNEEMVNAYAESDRVHVTIGMLNFCKSDDELAAVLGHELAHVARGHYKRKAGAMVVNAVASITLGVTAEVFVPGLGDLVQAGTQSVGNMAGLRFSRDLEREADYFGLKFMRQAGFNPKTAVEFQNRLAVEIPGTLSAGYFNTHPSSAERSLRLQKSIEELAKAGN